MLSMYLIPSEVLSEDTVTSNSLVQKEFFMTRTTILAHLWKKSTPPALSACNRREFC